MHFTVHTDSITFHYSQANFSSSLVFTQDELIKSLKNISRKIQGVHVMKGILSEKTLQTKV